ncbi:cation diffusion facilitator family transporter [Phycicoccus badiiscoriae]|uniref:Cation diffusion facilitator family transporter n=1 Tax=Pedococcus badiiscoriae TaxID=642776 RepID=A0A852WEM6_9MICO|nr:cation diffusion facilitator family transporter [Pedococcus badiiscoriae]NYG07687.1 cation diffusion facilitator family transporter [Pedococcus badiiscoriae]
MSTEGGTRAVVAALLANLGIAVTKFIAFFLTGFSSMLAEAIHSLADSGNQLLLLTGGRRAKRAATPEHPFGYGRERYVYAFIVSIVLFSVGGLFALYEAYHKWHETHAMAGFDPFSDQHGGSDRWWWVPVVVLLVAIVLEGFSFRTAILESDKVRGRRSWLEFVRGAKAPELPVILLEDLAALLGLVFALLGVSLMLVTGNPIFDVIGTGLIGLLLVTVAVFLAVEMKSLLLGESASPQHIARIVAAIESVGVIDRVIHQRTLHVGPEEVVVAAKVAVPAGTTAEAIAEAINTAEARAREATPDLTLLMYLEPDIDTGTRERPEWEHSAATLTDAADDPLPSSGSH